MKMRILRKISFDRNPQYALECLLGVGNSMLKAGKRHILDRYFLNINLLAWSQVKVKKIGFPNLD